ncbi:splicing regulator SDE2 [Echeneis naucrates]|uniref:splicing regulator SDE2 n=1 Tax=Echeneis naucrates TaxID=173247 RepID=UPI001113A4F6|nr:replication stress response regulator SDE2 [Echeneis naucrates]
MSESNMEVTVCAPRPWTSRTWVFPAGSVVEDVRTWFNKNKDVSSEDFYVVRNGRLSDLQDLLEHGAVYHLEPRLCGGKGGFGSMLRALGAQIEKTTNREACRDLSGRRLRDVNHEKEMAEWLKKQSDREAEKEQRRLERLQRKLAEPKHQFTDPEYQQQCHDLSERLEDSVLKGLQASSSAQVYVDDVSAAKRSNPDQSEQPDKKKKKTSSFWTGIGELDGLLTDDDDDDDDDESPSTSSSTGRAVAMTTVREATGCLHTSSSSLASDHSVSSEEQRPPETGPSEEQRPPETRSEEAKESSNTLEYSCRSEQQESSVDLSLVDLTSVHQLESLGLDVLKRELMSRGLKCGGTLSERATRLLSIRGLTPDQIPSDLLAKPGKTRRK